MHLRRNQRSARHECPMCKNAGVPVIGAPKQRMTITRNGQFLARGNPLGIPSWIFLEYVYQHRPSKGFEEIGLFLHPALPTNWPTPCHFETKSWLGNNEGTLNEMRQVHCGGAAHCHACVRRSRLWGQLACGFSRREQRQLEGLGRQGDHSRVFLRFQYRLARHA